MNDKAHLPARQEGRKQPRTKWRAGLVQRLVRRISPHHSKSLMSNTMNQHKAPTTSTTAIMTKILMKA